MLSHLPTSDHSPRPSAGIWPLAAAVLLIPLDLALSSYGESHPQVVSVVAATGAELQATPGVDPEVRADELIYELYLYPLWVGGARVAVPVLALSVLVALGRISRQDVGLALGRPRVTLFWVVAPAVVVPAVGLVALLGTIAVVRGAGLSPPSGFGEPMSPRVFWLYDGYVWRTF
jgi:hypothetical protein